MQPATTTARTFQIDGMSGDACVRKAHTALKGLDGIRPQSVMGDLPGKRSKEYF